ncbi:MAG: hypothetical protein NZ992_04390, partial [Candidatus Korarchaeum sp.]|nr:hypothetical protein [Candidatus Korarchaeum sp.]MDW8036108.1 hypothetical protein [Candidatus Korarchaeum sp.]
MRVKVNGIEIKAPKDATIEEILKENDFPYDPRCIIALVRREEAPRVTVERYILKTNRGEIVLKINDFPLWEKIEKKITGLKVYWKTRRMISMGAFRYYYHPTSVANDYDPGTVALSVIEGNGYLLFNLTRSRIEHYTEGTGVIGRVIRGFDVLEKLDVDDYIIEVE